MTLGCQAFSSLLMAASTKGLMSLPRLQGFEHIGDSCSTDQTFDARFARCMFHLITHIGFTYQVSVTKK